MRVLFPLLPLVAGCAMGIPPMHVSSGASAGGDSLISQTSFEVSSASAQVTKPTVDLSGGYELQRRTERSQHGFVLALATRVGVPRGHEIWLGARAESLLNRDQPGDRRAALMARAEIELSTGVEGTAESTNSVAVAHGRFAIGGYVQAGAALMDDGAAGPVVGAGLSIRLPALLTIVDD